MRKLITSVLLFICGVVSGQGIYTPTNPTVFGSNNLRLKASLALNIPEKDDKLTYTTDTTAQIFYYKPDNSIWAYSKARGFWRVGESDYSNKNSISAKGNTIVVVGDSYVDGAGASVVDKRWSTMFCRMMGANEVNLGIGGSTLEKRTPKDYIGVSSVNLIDRLSSIPVKTNDIKLVILSFGLNDIGQNGTNYNVTNFKTDYDSAIHYIKNRGYLPSQILIVSPYWIGQTGYNTYATLNGGNGAPNKQRHSDFVDATKEIASKWQTLYVNVFKDQKENDTTLLVGDGIHPNDLGHSYIAFDIYKGISGGNPLMIVQDGNSFSPVGSTNTDVTTSTPTSFNLGAEHRTTFDQSKAKFYLFKSGNIGTGIDVVNNKIVNFSNVPVSYDWRMGTLALDTSYLKMSLTDFGINVFGFDTSTIHVGGNTGGGFLTAFDDDSIILSSGSYAINSNWIAATHKSTHISQLGNNIYLYADTGLVIGVPYNPTPRTIFYGNGDIRTTGKITTKPATSDSNVVIKLQLDSLANTSIKTGTAFFSGDGSTTTFDISLPTTPTWVGAEASSAAGSSITYRSPITNGIRIFYSVAPVTGTNNISISYQYK